MSIWKDSDNNLHDDMNGEALNSPFWPSGLIELTEQEVIDIRTPTPAQQLQAELAALATAYKLDMQELNIGWLAAMVADGPQETAKKEIVTTAITERKTKYLLDVTETRNKYL